MKSTLIGLFSLFYLVLFSKDDGRVKIIQKHFIDKKYCEKALARQAGPRENRPFKADSYPTDAWGVRCVKGPL